MTSYAHKHKKRNNCHNDHDTGHLQNSSLFNVDNILLLICAVIVAGRSQINESFPLQLHIISSPFGNIVLAQGETTIMALMAGVIAACGFMWFVRRCWVGPISLRTTCLTGPFALLVISGVIASSVASNKHDAVVAMFNLLSAMLLAILLIQLLDKPWKQRLLLAVIAAVGVTAAWRCWEQYHYELDITIQSVEKNPLKILTEQHLEPGSYEAKQFLARVKSRDIGGFFAISNTQASFFILSIAATAGLLLPLLLSLSSRLSQLSLSSLSLRKLNGCVSSRYIFYIVVLILALLAQLFGLFLTDSKGGIASCLSGLLLMGVLVLAGDYLRRHWRVVVVFTIIAVTMVCMVVAIYGLRHNRLPGNSMWLRWQYWRATASMIAEHWFVGVGPHNFGEYYPRYMNPAAPEIVKDPHSFPLAIWSQWGVMGFLAFMWAIAAVFIFISHPFARKSFALRLFTLQRGLPVCDYGRGSIIDTGDICPVGVDVGVKRVGAGGCGGIVSAGGFVAWYWVLFLVAGVLLVRLGASNLSGISQSVVFSVVLFSFIIPVVIWAGSFYLLFMPLAVSFTKQPGKHKGHINISINRLGILLYFKPSVLAIGCGLAAFLLHNTIDFAIFQPGVGSSFWAMVAVAIAAKLYSPVDVEPGTPKAHKAVDDDVEYVSSCGGKYLRKRARVIMALVSFGLVVAVWLLYVVPVCRAKRYLDLAQQSSTAGDFEAARTYAVQASLIDTRDPAGPRFLGRLYFSRWQSVPADTKKQSEMFMQQALRFLQEAIMRNRAQYSYYITLSHMYQAAGQVYADKNYARLAIQYARKALERFPCDTSLLVEYARLLARQGQINQAAKFYTQALKYENLFLRQQRIMYPKRKKLVPRLDPEQRILAVQFLEHNHFPVPK